MNADKNAEIRSHGAAVGPGQIPVAHLEAADLLAQDTPILREFWESPSLDELAQAQNVVPIMDIPTLFGAWPGEIDDGFEEAIDELRHSSIGAV